jgi:electron transport complex protein RnfG
VKETIKLSVALTLICGIASAILAFGFAKTKDAIDQAALQEREQALGQVLPEFDNKPLTDKAEFTADDGSTVVFYRARQGNRLVALGGEGSTGLGYGGQIKILVGLEPDGKIRTVISTVHNETPGLGTKAVSRTLKRSFWSLFAGKSKTAGPVGLPPSVYLDQYNGQTLEAAGGSFKVKQDGGTVDAVSGATVSSRAIADALSRVTSAFAAHKSEILAQ